MATSIDWTSTLPQAYEKGSFSSNLQGNILRTDMDAGLSKVRRLYTAVADDYTGNMVFTGTQKITFEAFFKSSLGYGINTFNFPCPFDSGATTVEVRFKIDTKSSPYTVSPHGETQDWVINLNLEVVP